jgi:Trypsin-like peptidase domain
VEAEEARQRAKVAAVEARRTAEQARSTGEAAQNPLSTKAQELLNRLAAICDDQDLAEAKGLVGTLRDEALYEKMGALAEAVSRRDPKDARNRRLYAQYLINTGKATAAIDLLAPLAERLPKDDPEFAEAMGLIGHANKQIFFDAGDKADPSARSAIEQAIAAYRIPFEESPQKNIWHGVNLVALLDRTRRLGLQIVPDLSLRQVSEIVVAELAATPQQKRDPVWYLPTLAEASLGLGDWDVVEENVRAYAASDQVRPFQIENTLRQFTQVWDIEAMDERGRGLVAALRTRLLQLTGGEIKATPEETQRWQKQPAPTARQLEAVLGIRGVTTYQWWEIGLKRASSICAVRQRLGKRFGSGFLLTAGDLGLQPPEELVVLTNFHIVNKEGALGALTPETAEVVFEFVDAVQAWPVKTILWSSPAARHDASVLRFQGTVAGVAPLPLAVALPPVENNTKVYIIGYPRGQDLAFSFQDNELLDHEGPPGGAPQIPGVSRIHYRTPTEPGSSGSPVFDAKDWEVIALHHKASNELPRLNGKAGSYAANEGISILSIKGAIERGEME